MKGVPFFGAAVSSSEFQPQDLSAHSGYYRGPVERRVIPTGILVALSVVLLILFVLWCTSLSTQLQVKPTGSIMQARAPLRACFGFCPPPHLNAQRTSKGMVMLTSVTSSDLPFACVQENAEMVLHLLLSLLLHKAYAIPRGSAGDDEAVHHKADHCSAWIGRLRLLRLWHEPD